MIITNRSDLNIEVLLGGAITTNALDVYCAYSDIPSASFANGQTRTTVSGATPVVIVPGVTEASRRNVEYISVYNADTVAAVVTIQANDGTTQTIIISVSLAPGSTLEYNPGNGWSVKTTAGGVPSVVSTDYIDFTPLSAPAYTRGRAWYDSTNETISFYDDITGTSIQVSQEAILRAHNSTGSTITNGQVVYVNGASGINPTVALAQADALATCTVIGVATHNIANGSVGKITLIGSLSDLDTSAWTPGTALYLSPTTAGLLTSTAPTSPNFNVFVAYVLIQDATAGKIFTRPEPPISLNTALSTSNRVPVSPGAVKSYVDALIQYSGDIVFTGTITWTGTAPSGATNHRIMYSKVGNQVSAAIFLNYAVAGVGITNVLLTSLTQLPDPVFPDGWDIASSIINRCLALAQTSQTAATTATAPVIRKNSGNTDWEVAHTAAFSSGSYRYFQVYLNYICV